MVSVAVMKARTTSSGITKMRSGAEPQAASFDNNLTTMPVARRGMWRHAPDDSPNTICGAPA